VSNVTAKLLEIADPLTLVLERLEKHFRDDAALRARLCKLTSYLAPDPAQVVSPGEGDLPELRVVPGKTDEFNPFSTSTAGGIRQSFDVEVTTSDLWVDRMWFPLKWALYCSLSRMPADDGSFLGLEFVRSVTCSSVVEGLAELQAGNAGSKRWAGVLTLVIDMNFDHADVA